MLDAQPTVTHMAIATLIHKGLGHYVVTTNLDGLHRKSGLQGHTQICNLHGDVYIERCTACKYDFERNYSVRQQHKMYVHDHKIGTCSKCGSTPSSNYLGKATQGARMQESKWGGIMVGTRDVKMGTKDTHINFEEFLDELDWNEAEEHCGKADLCIVAGTSMSLRHITHFPFMAKKVVIINLQATPDDDKCNLRIWSQTDPVFLGLMERLKLDIEPIPVWRPRDSLPFDQIPGYIDPPFIEAAKRLEWVAQQREKGETKISLTLPPEMRSTTSDDDSLLSKPIPKPPGESLWSSFGSNRSASMADDGPPPPHILNAIQRGQFQLRKVTPKERPNPFLADWTRPSNISSTTSSLSSSSSSSLSSSSTDSSSDPTSSPSSTSTTSS